MERAERIAELERLTAEATEQAHLLLARVEGHRQELRALRQQGDQLARDPDTAQSLTEAVLAVLRSAQHALRPKEVVEALRSAGREDDYKTVTATLNYLLKQDRVSRPQRARYIPVP